MAIRSLVSIRPLGHLTRPNPDPLLRYGQTTGPIRYVKLRFLRPDVKDEPVIRRCAQECSPVWNQIMCVTDPRINMMIGAAVRPNGKGLIVEHLFQIQLEDAGSFLGTVETDLKGSLMGKYGV